MDKGGKVRLGIITLLVLIGIFSLYFVIAETSIDNIKDYDDETETITISDNELTELAEYKLIENTDQCLINCYAEGIATLYVPEKLFDSLKFKNIKGEETNIKEDKILLWITEEYEVEVNDYIEVCEDVYDEINQTTTEVCTMNFTETHKEPRIKEFWEEYNFEILEAGTYKWRIEGKKNPNQRIDWIGTSFGKELTEWAWWNSDYEYKRNITGMLETVPLAINGTTSTTLGGTATWIYGTCAGDGCAIYYNDSTIHAIANDTDEFWKVQTIPAIRVSGTAPSGLELYMPFDNEESEAIDFTGNNNFTIQGTITQGVDSGLFNSYTLDSTDDFLNKTGTEPFQGAYGTVVMRFEPTLSSSSMGSQGLWFAGDDATFHQSNNFYWGANTIRGYIGGTLVLSTVNTAGWFNAGDQVHMVYTWDVVADKYNVYINKVLKHASTTAATNTTTTERVVLLHHADLVGDFNFKGNFSHMEVYNRVLTSTELNATFDLLTSLSAEETEAPPDSTNPNVTIVSPLPINYTEHSIDFNVTAIDETAMSSCWYTLNSGVTNYTMTNSTAPDDYTHTNSSITKGSYTVNFYCNDTSDNLNDTEQVTFTILNAPPTHSNPTLTTPNNKNLSTQDLTCNNQSTSDVDGDNVLNIYNWYKNSQSLLALNLPFEINADDYSGYDNDGAESGNPQLISGKVGNGYEFDGDDSILIQDSNSLDFAEEKTWQLWFKRATTGAEELFNKGNATISNYKLEFLGDDKLKFSYSLIPGWQQDIEEFNLNKGTYTSTYYNTTTSAVVLDNSYSGDYQSEIFNDSMKELSFNSIIWSADVPTVAELSVEEDMVGLWHFNENSGNITYDETANDNDGTVYGASWTTEGKFNNALDFDGDGDYVDLDNFASKLDDFSTGTISVWTKGKDLSAMNTIFSVNKDSNNRGKLVYDPTGFVCAGGGFLFNLRVGGVWVIELCSDNNVTSDWTHIAITQDGTTSKIYINGVAQADTDSGEWFDDIATLLEVDIGRRADGDNFYFNGTIDEVAIYNKSLSASEILDNYNKGIGAITNLSLSVRSCENNDCSDKGVSWDIEDLTGESVDISSLSNNIYFQFKADFETNDTNYSPKLYNVTLNYSKQTTETEANITSTSTITNDGQWHLATITYDNSGDNNLKLYINDTLDKQKTESSLPAYKDNDLIIGQGFNGSIDEFRIYQEALTFEQITNNYLLNYNKIVSNETSGGDEWMCQVTPNDGEDDGLMKSSGNLSVLWAIEFNVTDSFSGASLDDVTISCDYTEFDQLGDYVNSYGPYGFPPGNWECNFSVIAGYYFKEQIFSADDDKTVPVQLSEELSLTVEEHTWLEWLYTCWNGGDCWNLLQNINQTTTQTWERIIGTNTGVITQEDVLSYELSGSSNISINYTIDVPYKPEVPVNELLPIRMYFWFTDVDKTQCYSQDKGTDTNRAESSYCLPLVAEILGPNDGTVNFQVDLSPNLPAGTYNFTRSIEIDPLGVWTQYGREDIGQIEIVEGGDAGIGVSDELITNKLISSSPNTGGSSGGDSVTNVYNTYVTGEDGEDESVGDEITSEENGGARITGGAIGTNLLSGGSLVFIVAIIGGILIVFIVSRTILQIKKK